MIKCWTVWKAAVAARPRLSHHVAAPKVVTGIRRVRRARRAAVSAVVLYPTIVCTVVGGAAALRSGGFFDSASGGPPSMGQHQFQPLNQFQPPSLDQGQFQPLNIGPFQRDMGWTPVGPDTPITPVPEPGSLILLGSALAAFAAWRLR